MDLQSVTVRRSCLPMAASVRPATCPSGVRRDLDVDVALGRGARLSHTPETPGMEDMKEVNWSVARCGVASSSCANE